MRPWAGLDDDDEEDDDANGSRAMPLTPEALGALGLLADAGAAGGSDYVSKWVTEQLPVAPTDAAASAAAASAAAAAAGRRLKPAPAPAQMVAAAADGVRARARRAPPRVGFRSPGSRDGAGTTATATSSPSRSVAEAAADASVPRARRLTLHPEFVAAVADDYASIVAARDWRDAFARVADEARADGRRELKILDVGCGAGAFLAALAASGALDAFHDFGTGFGDAGVMDDEEETIEHGRDEGPTDEGGDSAGRDAGRHAGRDSVRDYGRDSVRDYDHGPRTSPAPAPRLRASLHSTSSSTDAVVLRVDLLDTSPSALRAASASLAPPLALGGLRCATAREYASALAAESAADGFVAPRGDVVAGSANSSLAISPDRRYDVVWAMHSLEHLPAGVSAGDAGVAAALRSIRALLRPGGLGFLAVAAAESHACRFRGLYRREFGRGSALAAAENARARAFGTVVGSNPGFGANANADAETELATAEHVVAALAARGASHNRTDASHVVVIDADDRARLEAYLHGCAGDDAVSLDTMLANPRVGAYLASCRVPDGSKYAFPQKTAHITL